MTVTPPGQGPGATGATFAWGPFRPFAFLAAPTSPEYEAPPKDQSQLVSGRPRYYSRGRLSPFKFYRGQAPCLPRPRFLVISYRGQANLSWSSYFFIYKLIRD